MKRTLFFVVFTLSSLLSFNLIAASSNIPLINYETILLEWQNTAENLKANSIQRIQDYALFKADAVCLALEEYKNQLFQEALVSLTTTPPALVITTSSVIQITTSSALQINP